ncbi:MAG: ABC transporter permease subunit [Methylophaga sp.]|nr:ABC transporter permease subunit [Methylophaga sp.]
MSNVLLTVAGKEFRDGLRNRWVLSISLIFAILATGLAYFGSAASGQAGFSSLSATMVSLATLAVILIPLIALMLSYDSVVGEDEQGTLLLLMTYPMKRWQFISGKMLGHGLILACASVTGFGLSALVTGAFSDNIIWSELLAAYVFFIIFSVLLGWIFIAFAYVISVSVTEKSKAAGIALIVWFCFVLMFDLILLGLLVTTEGNVNAETFPYLLMLNPTDIYRLAIIQYFADQQLSGLMAVAQQARFTTRILFCGMLFWLLMPLLYSLLKFNNRTF